jgi:hypothetical protein
MQVIQILAAAQTGGSALDDMLRLIGIAAIVVAFFKGIRSLMNKNADAPKAMPRPADPPAVAARPEANISPEIIAVIAAAVATISNHQPVRIVSIKPMSTSWERAGRHSVLTSHRIR